MQPQALSPSLNRWLALSLAAALACAAAQATPDGPVRHGGERAQPGRGGHGPARDADSARWTDRAHGHNRDYPNPGWAVRVPPPHARTVVWGGVPYRHWDGVWYSPGPRGHVVVRPPYGVVVGDLPLFRTLVVVGGLTYLYLNGTYYRERSEGGYEVVAPPVDASAETNAAKVDKVFVYPRQGQSAQQQASDEYECHRWAVTQTGFDPSAQAVGQIGSSQDLARRNDYGRARSACLEGRGYTVR